MKQSKPENLALAELLSSLSASQSITVSQAWELRKAETQPVAMDRLEYAWRALLPYFGHRDIASLLPLDFKNYVKARTTGKRAVQLSTVRRELSELSTTINHLVKTKRLSSLHAPHVPLPAHGKAKAIYLSTDEKKQLLEAAMARRTDPAVPSRVELFLHVGWEAGQRRRAIERLEWEQVDFKQSMVHFMKDGEVATKKRKVSVPMSPVLRAVLEAESERATTQWVLREPGSIRTTFESLMEHCGMPHVTPHTLRHTFVSHLLMRDVPVFTVAQLAGMTVKLVETTYGHLSQSHLHAALAG